jgi:predicted DNA-binding protein with PD1-like motif
MAHLARHGSTSIANAPRQVTPATALVDDLVEKEASRFLTSALGLALVLALGGLSYKLAKQSQQAKRKGASKAKFFALRLKPGVEIKSAIQAYVQEHDLRAGAIVSCVGSTATAYLRLSNAKAGEDGSFLELRQPSEIVSLTGTVSVKGSHLHISLGDEKGDVFGGHLVNATVNTTCELVIAELNDLEFSRPKDEATGYGELEVNPRHKHSFFV